MKVGRILLECRELRGTSYGDLSRVLFHHKMSHRHNHARYLATSGQNKQTLWDMVNARNIGHGLRYGVIPETQNYNFRLSQGRVVENAGGCVSRPYRAHINVT